MKKLIVTAVLATAMLLAVTNAAFASPPPGKGWRKLNPTPTPTRVAFAPAPATPIAPTATPTSTPAPATPSPTPTSTFNAKAYAVTLVNHTRAQAGAPALTEDALLNSSAQAKAEDMAVNNYFSHTSSNGWQPWDWMTSAGAKWSYAAENLAAINPVDWSVTNQPNVINQLHNMLVNSSTHYAVMSSKSAHKIGIGFYYRTSDQKMYYVEHYTD